MTSVFDVAAYILERKGSMTASGMLFSDSGKRLLAAEPQISRSKSLRETSGYAIYFFARLRAPRSNRHLVSKTMPGAAG